MYKEFAPGERPETLERLARQIRGADAFIIVSGEYNHSIPPALSNLLDRLPEELRQSPELDVLRPAAQHKVYNLVQLIYRSKRYEGDSKDYEFSRQSMEEHWSAGYHDTARTLRHPEVLERPSSIDGVFTFDIDHDGRE